ncbi:uncharacterized protein LOC135941527 [Cloeon dipterum]|uniref:uncharacterized protein LOC135941527 n=1 Tax=Cloeon dipterum TaxID=197152 RepID=UPI00321FF35E
MLMMLIFLINFMCFNSHSNSQTLLIVNILQSSPLNRSLNISSIGEMTSLHHVARDVFLEMERNDPELTAFLVAEMHDDCSNKSHQQRIEKLLKRQIEHYLKAGEQSQQIDMEPSDVAAEASKIRSEMQQALRVEVTARISLFIEGNIEGSKMCAEPLENRVSATDSKMNELYHLILRRTTCTFIDLHYLTVMEAKTVMTLYLQLISPLPLDCHPNVTIVTGRGLHSKDGIPKLQPAIKSFLGQHRIRYEECLGSFRI